MGFLGGEFLSETPFFGLVIILVYIASCMRLRHKTLHGNLFNLLSKEELDISLSTVNSKARLHLLARTRLARSIHVATILIILNACRHIREKKSLRKSL